MMGLETFVVAVFSFMFGFACSLVTIVLVVLYIGAQTQPKKSQSINTALNDNINKVLDKILHDSNSGTSH
jgi:hypothetical protein